MADEEGHLVFQADSSRLARMRAGTTVLVLAALLLCPFPNGAVALDDADKARIRTLTEEGVDFQADGRHEDALLRFDEALRLMDHPRVQYHKAVSLQALGRLDEARKLLLNIAGHPWLAEMAPDIKARLEEVTARLRPVAIHVKTPGAKGARVYLDGRFVGRSPIALKATPGERVLTIRLQGHRTVRDSIVVTPPGPMERSYRLKKARSGALVVECDSAGADVFLDELWMGTTPLKGPLVVEEGRHVIRLSRLGFAEKILDAEVVANEVRTVTVTLREGKGQKDWMAVDELNPVLAKSTLGGGVALFTIGLGFLIKHFVDVGKTSGASRNDQGSLSVRLGADRMDNTNMLVGGTLMTVGLTTGLSSLIFWLREDGEVQQ